MTELETAQAALAAAQDTQKALADDADEAARTVATAAVTTAQAALDAAKAKASQSQATFTQSDLDRIAAKTRDEEKAKYDKAKAAEKARADEERQKAQGEWQSIAEAREAKIKELEAAITDRDILVLKGKAGAKHKLPAELVELLKGGTEAELDAHAAALARHLAPPVAPNTEGGPSRRSSNGVTLESARKEQAASGRFDRY